MIDLSDIMEPLDIIIDTLAGSVHVTCREEFYEQVKAELKSTADHYYIPICLAGETSADYNHRERTTTDIYLRAYEVGLDPDTLAEKIGLHFESIGLKVFY